MDNVVYPYRKKPDHLTNWDDFQITEVCKEFERGNQTVAKNEILKGYIAKGRAKLQDQIAARKNLEEQLSLLEKSAITEKLKTRRNAIELDCKELRTQLLKNGKNISETETKVTTLEAMYDDVERTLQEQTIHNARTLVTLCKRVRARQEEKKKLW